MKTIVILASLAISLNIFASSDDPCAKFIPNSLQVDSMIIDGHCVIQKSGSISDLQFDAKKPIFIPELGGLQMGIKSDKSIALVVDGDVFYTLDPANEKWGFVDIVTAAIDSVFDGMTTHDPDNNGCNQACEDISRRQRELEKHRREDPLPTKPQEPIGC